MGHIVAKNHQAKPSEQQVIAAGLPNNPYYQHVASEHAPRAVDARSLWASELHLAGHSLSATGLLPNNAFWNYAEYRWMQAEKQGVEARFERYHPALMADLKKDFADRVVPVVPVVPVIPICPTLPVIPCDPHTTCPSDPGDPGHPNFPGSVPEPSTLVLMSIALVVIVLVNIGTVVISRKLSLGFFRRK